MCEVLFLLLVRRKVQSYSSLLMVTRVGPTTWSTWDREHLGGPHCLNCRSQPFPQNHSDNHQSASWQGDSDQTSFTRLGSGWRQQPHGVGTCSWVPLCQFATTSRYVVSSPHPSPLPSFRHPQTPTSPPQWVNTSFLRPTEAEQNKPQDIQVKCMSARTDSTNLAVQSSKW